MPKLGQNAITWEHRKLGELVKNVAKKNRDNLDLEPYAVTNDRGFIAQKEAHDDFGYMRDTDRKMYNIVPPNSFAYNPARINVGSLGYYTGTENVIVSSLYEVFQTEAIIDDRFLWHWLKSDHFPKWIEKLQEGSVRLYFYFDKLVQCQMMIPSIEEQKQIGSFFSSLDNLITLHQRECDLLLKTKKSYLQKMFPKNGEDKPEIRFVGFNDAWEQRKVKDLFKVTRGNVLAATITSEKKTEDAPYSVYSSQTKQNGLMGYYKEFLYEDAITWTTDGANAGTVNYRAGKFYCTNVCGVLLSNEIKANQMIAEALNNIAKKYVSYVGNPKLMNNVMADIEIKLPSQEKERDTISSFFCDLDNLITLHQRELDSLKDMKKSLLQQMFI